MSEEETLSERLRRVQMTEASEVDPARLEMAMREKAELANAAEVRASAPARQSTRATTTQQTGKTARTGNSRASGATRPASPAYDAHSEGARFADDRMERRARRQQKLLEQQAREEAARRNATANLTVEPQQKSKFGQWFMAGRTAQRKSKAAITVMPPLPANHEEVEFYDIEPPYSFARILRNLSTGDISYEVIEPTMTRSEQEIFKFIEAAMIRGLNVDPNELDQLERATYLNRSVAKILSEYRVALTDIGQRRIEYYIRRNYLGLGRIQPLMMDDDIEDISCDGPHEKIFIYHRRHESMITNVFFETDSELDGYVIRLAQRSGKALTISHPLLDASLPDGSRLQVTLAREVTQNGSTFTIRRFRPDPFTPMDLIKFGTMDARMLAYFWLTMQNGMNLVFAGGTASGKTTSLNAICQFIPHQVKVVTIEDTREVNLPHKNWIKAVTRTGTGPEGAGEIGMFDLLKASLRQRPDFIVVGEVRGVEATVAFQAMATGHAVYSTMHADSARSVVYRLENEPINIPRLVLQALDIIVIQSQVKLGKTKVRRITEVVELVGMDPQTRELLTNTIFKWDPETDQFKYVGRSYMIDRIAQAQSWSAAKAKGELQLRTRILEQALRRGHVDMEQFNRIVLTYARTPEKIIGALER